MHNDMIVFNITEVHTKIVKMRHLMLYAFYPNLKT